MKNLKLIFLLVISITMFSCSTDDNNSVNELPKIKSISLFEYVVDPGTRQGMINEDIVSNNLLTIGDYYLEEENLYFNDVTVTLLTNETNLNVKLGNKDLMFNVPVSLDLQDYTDSAYLEERENQNFDYNNAGAGSIQLTANSTTFFVGDIEIKVNLSGTEEEFIYKEEYRILN